MAHYYIKSLVALFGKHADAEIAVGAAKYMRDQFSFLGIKSPKRAALSKIFYSNSELPPLDEMPGIVNTLWEQEHREYQYFAMEFCYKYRKQFTKEHIKLIEYLVLNKSWWDTVDYIASNLAGPYFKMYPEQIIPITTRWVKHKSFWLRRTALLFQLKYHEDTDAELLFNYADRLKHEDEFFIRKAIGWSLRQYAKSDPAAVKRYVKTANLKPLSEKEALKNL